MKIALVSLALAGSLIAEEVSENVKTASPNGAFQVTIEKVGDTNMDRLNIKNKDGKVVFTYPPRIDEPEVLEFFPRHLRWSPDSRILAISAGYQKAFRTYLFAWDGKGFHRVALPEIAAGRDNPWIYPVVWKENHILHLEVSGPHAGKARDGGYGGTAVVQVDLQTKAAKKLSEEIKDYDSDENQTEQEAQ